MQRIMRSTWPAFDYRRASHAVAGGVVTTIHISYLGRILVQTPQLKKVAGKLAPISMSLYRTAIITFVTNEVWVIGDAPPFAMQ